MRIPGAMDRHDQVWAFAATMLFVAAGMIYIRFVPPGLPYDEPAHFSVVQMYSQLDGMPVMGPGVPHEACHPPLYYFLFGLLYRVLSGGGIRFAFYALRIATLLAAAPLVYLAYKAAREFSGRRQVAQLAAVFVAMNPSILGIASSVQNDTLLFLLCTLAAYLCVRWSLTQSLTLIRTTILGIVISAAVMTKTPALSLIPFVGAMVLFTYRTRSIGRLALLLVIFLAATGWWFERNHVLYHDWTGSSTVAGLFGVGVGRFDVTSLTGWKDVAKNLVAYYTVPVEYWRNEIHTPRWIALLAVTGAALGVFGFVLAIFRRRPFGGAFAIWFALYALAAWVFWLAVSIQAFYVPARVGMAGCVALIFLAAGSINLLRVRLAGLGLPRGLLRHWPVALAIILAMAQAQMLARVVAIVQPPFIVLTADNNGSRP